MNSTSENISDLELDLLLLFFTLSDQYGKVHMDLAKSIAYQKLGVILPTTKQFVLKQRHIDILIKHNLIPDISDIIIKSKNFKSQKKKRNN